MTENSKNTSGFAIDSWANLASFSVVCVAALGGISWGLKLESRIDKYSDMQNSMRERFLADIATTQSLLARGILPVTEVKIQSIENRVNKLEVDIDQCVRKNKLTYPLSLDNVLNNSTGE